MGGVTTNAWHYDKFNLTVGCRANVGICDEKGVLLVPFPINNIVWLNRQDAKNAKKFQ
jgi:hypothetical protein